MPAYGSQLGNAMPQKKEGPKPLIQNVNQENDPMLHSPQMNQLPMYHDGGDVPEDQVAKLKGGERVLNPVETHAYKSAALGNAPETPLGRISARAHELMDQGKALAQPLDSEAEAFKEKQKSIDEGTGMRPLQPSKPAPMAPVGADKINPSAEYGNRPAEKRLDPQGNEINPTTPQGMGAAGPKLPTLPSYDTGGDVPQDQVAQVHEDEHVLDPKEAEAYRQAEQEEKAKQFPEPSSGPVEVKADTDAPTTPKNSADMDVSNAPMKAPMQLASEKTPLGAPVAPRGTALRQLPGSTPEAAPAEEPKEESAPDPMAIIKQDQLDAMKRGQAGLADLGLAKIHENMLGGKATPNLPAETTEMPKYTGTERLGKGTPGEAEAHKQLEEKRREYDTRIQAAMDQGTPEGDREAASLQLAKQHFDKMNPLGSAANRPGALGKAEHILGRIGNIAGDIVAPSTMALIPGTDLNKQRQAQQLRGQEQEATKESLEQAQARVAGAKTVPEQVYNWAMRGNNGGPQINPDTNKPFTPEEAQVISTGVGKTPVQALANGLMHEKNPETGKNYTQVEALDEAMKRQAGNKLNEHQRRVADYVSAHHMEDTPQNRETARIAIEKADTEAKQQSELPFSEAKAKFNNALATTRALLVQQNADANARGLKADELQNTENARSSSVTAKIQTAKDALNAADEEQFAAQITPIVSLLAVTSAEGVKRVNKQELDKFVPASGSFGRWIDAHAEQFLSGKIPAEYKTEVGHMLDRMTAAETAEHIINTQSIDNTVRSGAQEPVQTPKGGASATPKKSESKGNTEPPKPAGGTTGGFSDWKKKQQQANQPK